MYNKHNSMIEYDCGMVTVRFYNSHTATMLSRLLRQTFKFSV